MKYLFSLIFLIFIFLSTHLAADNCLNNAKSCSEIEICAYATFEKDGMVFWDDPGRIKFVKEAQSRNLTCGVGNAIEPSIDRILSEKFINQVKTKRITEIDWKGLECKNSVDVLDYIWFNENKYITFDKDNFKINSSDKRPYIFYGVSKIILENFYGKKNHLILNRQTLDFKSTSQGFFDEYSIEKNAKECQDDVTKCTHFELCVFATHGIYRQINQYRPRHVDQVKKLNIDCSLGIHMNKFYAKFSNFEGICKVKGALSELLDPLVQDIIKKIPKNKI